MTIDLRNFEVQVPIPGGETMRVDMREHREDVVRRLLELEVTPRILRAMLPDWTPLIDRVASEPQAEADTG